MPKMSRCVICFSGLPGSGKSTLARAIAEDARPLDDALRERGIPPARVVVVSYDELMRARQGDGAADGGFDPAAWRGARRDAIARARSALEAHTDPRAALASTSDAGAPAADQLSLAIILDDTMHYRSMRREVFRMARELSAAFVHVHVDAPLELATRRNAARPAHARVPRALVEETAHVLERAQPDRHRWERTTLTVDVARDADAADAGEGGAGGRRSSWASLLDPAALVREWLDNQLDLSAELAACEQSAALADASRAATMASVPHQLDLRCRQTIARTVGGAAGAALGRDDKRALAARLNTLRKDALKHCNQHTPSPAGGSTEGAESSARLAERVELLVDEEHEKFVHECHAAVRAVMGAAADDVTTTGPAVRDHSHSGDRHGG